MSAPGESPTFPWQREAQHLVSNRPSRCEVAGSHPEDVVVQHLQGPYAAQQNHEAQVELAAPEEGGPLNVLLGDLGASLHGAAHNGFRKKEWIAVAKLDHGTSVTKSRGVVALAIRSMENGPPRSTIAVQDCSGG
jgi:hypothetical protein